MKFPKLPAMTAAAALSAALIAAPASAQDIFVGHLADNSGATSDVGTPDGQGVADALAYIILLRRADRPRGKGRQGQARAL
jgi:hypothetical protein